MSFALIISRIIVRVNKILYSKLIIQTRGSYSTQEHSQKAQTPLALNEQSLWPKPRAISSRNRFLAVYITY